MPPRPSCSRRLSQVQGVGQVSRWRQFAAGEFGWNVNPTQLNNYGLGLQDVAAMLSRRMPTVPRANSRTERPTADISTNDQLLQGGGLHAFGGRLPQWRSPSNFRCRRTSMDSDGKHSRCRLRQRQALRPHHYLPPAGRQHHRYRGPHPRRASAAEGLYPLRH